jgi:hypothetical protein
MSDRYFAFGRNHYDGCDCPAVEAGRSSEEMEEMGALFDMISSYDDIAQTRYSPRKGTVVEKKAKRNWFQAIEELRDRQKHDAADVGVEIAETLGWE